jgi:hypothetical protein
MMDLIKNENNKTGIARVKDSSVNTTIANLTTGLAGMIGGAALCTDFGIVGSIIGSVLAGILLYYLAVKSEKQN